MRSKSLVLFCWLSVLLSITACVEDDQPTDGSHGFERQPYLADYAENVIIPGYKQYLESLTELQSAANDYQTDDNLAFLKECVLKSWYKWQYIAFYNFGPALENGILAQTNTYPTNITRVESNISADAYKLGSVSNYAAKGFPALDYLLFSKDQHTTAERKYIKDLVDDLTSLADKVVDEWSQDSEVEAFISRDGNDVGSSLGLMINAFNQYLERDFRNGKIAIPIGWQSGGTILTDHIEGYYSGDSKELLLHGAKGIRAFYNNISPEGIDKLGIKEMLETIGTRYQDGNLTDEVENDIQYLIESIENINAPMDELLLEGSDDLNTIYVATKKLVVQFKSNIPSALGVMITYQDNDGD